MECVDSTDVSWISQPQHVIHGFIDNFKESSSRAQAAREICPTELKVKDHPTGLNDNVQLKKGSAPTLSKIGSVSRRPSFSKLVAIDKNLTIPSSSSLNINNHNRRNSWLSSISSRFTSTSSHANISQSTIATGIPESIVENSELVLPSDSNSKNTLLPHAQKQYGDVPYTPALPRTSHTSFLQSALRRLSNSGSQAATVHTTDFPESGLCERRVLNIDKNRERCVVKGINPAKLRRVSFCVDVEVSCASQYYCDKTVPEKVSKKGKKQKEKQISESERNETPPDSCQQAEEGIKLDKIAPSIFSEVNYLSSSIKKSKKMEKKKRNEAERKAKKEKNRKLAEAQGSVPFEVMISNSEEISQTSLHTTFKPQDSPTTDPLRVYRRCCQLRETVVIEKIAEQVADPSNQSPISGVINQLNLSGHWIEISDIITLGDYLAIVPVTELIMENCGLTDETVRIILAGLLAAKLPSFEGGRLIRRKNIPTLTGSFVEIVVLKNNPRIGRDGWEYICTFIAMCRSLKSIDLSQIPFPQPNQYPENSKETSGTEVKQENKMSDISDVLRQALSVRAAGKELEILNLAECYLTSNQLSNLVDGSIESGLYRLGVAGNKLDPDGMKNIVRYIRHGQCIGLDLSSNDLGDQIEVFAEALSEEKELCALSLADCNLSPDSLRDLFPALVRLKNFRFIDFSNNPLLFNAEQSALSLFRRYLPQMESLKRIHLMAVSLNSEQAIALVEILPDMPNLTHINIMNNPLRSIIENSSAKFEAEQEEACALYTSLMTAVRVSKTLICIDIEVPSPDSSEIVKALADQVVAYCLWNMEYGPVAEINAANFAQERKDAAIPDALRYLVGHGEEDLHVRCSELEESTRPDQDYVISGTGIVKALSICLQNHGDDSRLPLASDIIPPTDFTNIKSDRAKEMSKNLLGTARNIRSRLQAAVKESRQGDAANYQKLLVLDHTLENLIKRFEDEFPETRLLPALACSSPLQSFDQIERGHKNIDQLSESIDFKPSPTYLETSATASDEDSSCIRPMLSRHNSEVSLASRALGEEEGQMFRLSQKLKMDSFKFEGGVDADDNAEADWSVHLEMLKGMVGAVNTEKSVNSEEAFES